MLLRRPSLCAPLLAAALGACASSTQVASPEPGASPERASPALAWESPTPSSVACVDADGRLLFELRHGEGEDEPALHPLGLPGGPSLTVDRPSDHPWHHGLWFAWKFIDGVNYWEHGPEGRPVGRTSWDPPLLGVGGDGTARALLRLTYAHTGASEADPRVRLIEQRALVVHPPGADGTWALDWRSSFEAAGRAVTLDRTPLLGEPGGKVFGGYGGLSLRLAQLEERTVTSEHGPVAFSTEFRARPRAVALDYTGRPKPVSDALGTAMPGPAGIAVLEHPDNPRLADGGRAWYAIRSDAMTFFTPAVLTEGPLIVEPGQPLHLAWRIIVHPGAWDAERLARASERFAAGLAPPP
ncbi:MAG: PmoA family protein [Planctomycetota bacterium]|nr:PmoA family protein [Planctomycetota bacterium]